MFGINFLKNTTFITFLGQREPFITEYYDECQTFKIHWTNFHSNFNKTNYYTQPANVKIRNHNFQLLQF